MSTHLIILKPINEVAKFLKSLIPANIPEAYSLNPMFANIASDETIRNGIVAFRDFLCLVCDRLMVDGETYAKPPKKPSNMTDYPFLHNLTNLLVEMGYHGKLTPNGDSLLIAEMPLCIVTIDESGKKKSPKIPTSSQMACLRFLSDCGFVFTGVDLKGKSLKISESQPLEVQYPDEPALLTGLKVLSIADMELRTSRRYWNDHNLLRCDYRLIKADETDMIDVLKDFLHPLPQAVQDFALKLHERYTDKGMICTLNILGDVNFSYAAISKSSKSLSSRQMYQRRVFEFSNSMRHGYCLFVRAKKADKYVDVIGKFAPYLQEKIVAGYGCYRKLGRERCEGDCQGIRIPLDDLILDIGDDIIIWLNHEMPSSLKRK